MKETEWAKFVAEKLDRELSGFNVEAGKRLIYANEIVEYREDCTSYNEMSYETDILVYETSKDKSWKPRVVIETKIDSITTHDAITYSQKSATHKYVHPYLRYGIFLGNRDPHPLPGRLFRHGAHFDFMLSWKKYKPKDYEWDGLLKIIEKEIAASKKLEEMIFNSRCKQRKKYVALHKPLDTYHSLKDTLNNA
jgi:hypothetical protein